MKEWLHPVSDNVMARARRLDGKNTGMSLPELIETVHDVAGHFRDEVDLRKLYHKNTSIEGYEEYDNWVALINPMSRPDKMFVNNSVGMAIRDHKKPIYEIGGIREASEEQLDEIENISVVRVVFLKGAFEKNEK